MNRRPLLPSSYYAKFLMRKGDRGLFVACVLLFIALVIGRLTTIPSEQCQDGNKLRFSDVWRVSSANLNAKILWQLSEPKPGLLTPGLDPNSGIAVSPQQLIYAQDGWEACQIDEAIIAFDLFSRIVKLSTKRNMMPHPTLLAQTV
jgi:hypothetical protein